MPSPAKTAGGRRRAPPAGTAFDAACRILSPRPHSEAELRRKLAARRFPPAEVARAVAECRRLGYLDDDSLAADYAAELAERGYGPRAVSQRLARKGLPPAGAGAEAGRAAPDAAATLASARRAAARKIAALAAMDIEPRRKCERLARFLAGRGFDTDTVMAVVTGAAFGAADGGSDDPWAADPPPDPTD